MVNISLVSGSFEGRIFLCPEERNSFHEMDHEDYEWLMNINLMSNLHMSRLVLPYMVEQKSGNIINISSVGGLMEYGKLGIRVNAIAPGMIWTDMLRGVDQDQVNLYDRSDRFA